MVPPYAMYLLEAVWVNDHYNREFATLTVEGREGQRYETGFEVLVDPEGDPGDKAAKLSELREVAHALRRHYGGSHTASVIPARLVCLYRIVDQGEMPWAGNSNSRLRELHMKLEPICTFDGDGNPVPICPVVASELAPIVRISGEDYAAQCPERFAKLPPAAGYTKFVPVDGRAGNLSSTIGIVDRDTVTFDVCNGKCVDSNAGFNRYRVTFDGDRVVDVVKSGDMWN